MKKRASGAYQLEIRDQRLRGGRLSLSARTSSRPVARKREAAIRALLDRGELATVERLRTGDLHIADLERAHTAGDLDAMVQPEVPPLGQVVDRVLNTVTAVQAEGTRKQYAVVARQLQREFGKDFNPLDLTKEAAQDWLHRKRNGKPWSPRTMAQKCALAGRIWKDAGVPTNPWREVATPEVRATRFAFLRPPEWRTLIDKVRGLPVAAPLALGTLAGLRLSEAIHLRPGIDLDMDRRRLKVQARDGDYPWRPKTARGERSLRIGDELHGILSAHVDAGFSGERYLLRTAGQDAPVSASTLARMTREAFGKVGIRYGRAEGDALTFHSLRHTFASWLVQRDVQLMKVAKLLGDTELEVARTYGHLLPEDLDRAVDLVDEIAREGESG